MISEMRILKSNLYRFIFAGDFSFERRKLHPIINAAHTRRQTLSLKLTLYHLCMEYPNAENLCRIRVKKSKLCEICEDEGVSAVDNTEHNLFSCVCVTQDETASTMRESIYQTISRIKDLNVATVRRLATSDVHQAALIFLNPCSAGISDLLRIDYKNEYILFLCKLLQKYVLFVHNLRTRNGSLPSQQLRGGKPSLRTGSKGGPAQGERVQRGHPKGKTSLKKITDFFKSSNGNNECDITQLGLTRGQARSLDNSSWNWSVLGTVVGPKITLFSTMMTSHFGNREMYRSAVIKHHSNRGVIKTIVFQTDDSSIAKSLATVTVDAFDATMVDSLAQLGRFHIKASGDTEYPQQRTPITIICAKEPTPLKITVMEEFEEYISIVLADDRYSSHPKMKEDDKEKLQVEGRHLGRSILCENLENWASRWFNQNEWEVCYNTEKDTWPDSAWQRALLYLEYNKPGTAIYCSGKSEGNWPMATVAQVTKKTPTCKFVYRGDISTHFRAMYNSAEGSRTQSESSEWFLRNQGVVENFGYQEGDHITMMSRQLSKLMRDNQRLEVESENLKLTAKILAAHNQELLKHVTSFVCAGDAERKDGEKRIIRFKTDDEELLGQEMDSPHDEIEEEAAMIKTIIQNVVRPGDLRLGSDTTIGMEPDLRMKLMAAKADRAQTKVSPEDFKGPDLDELPEVKREVVTLQGLEGAVIRNHGATKGISTSSSSNSSETDITRFSISLEERSRQVLSIARGRANSIVRRAGSTESNRKISTGRGSGRGKPKGEPQVNFQPRHHELVKKLESKKEDSVSRHVTSSPAYSKAHSPASPIYSKAFSPAYTPAYSPIYSPGEPKAETGKPSKSARLEDSVFADVEDGAVSTLPIPSTEGGSAAVAGICRSRKEEAKMERTDDPYTLKEPKVEPKVKGKVGKNEVKGEPVKDSQAKMDSAEEMDVSVLRDSKHEELDTISETNLSEDQVVEEYPEVEVEKTERILEKMGTVQGSPGMAELCDDIVMLLHPTTSTPKARSEGSASSSLSTHPSMPPLGDGWSATSDSVPSDSGNATDSSDAPPSQAVTAADTVKVNLEDHNLFSIMIMTNIFCSRTPLNRPSEPRYKPPPDLCVMLFLQQSFIYLSYLSRHLSYYHVLKFSGANLLNKSLLSRNLALGK